MKLNKKLLDIFKKVKTTSDEYTYTCSYINDLVEDVYSTSEVKTNKVWIDNKPIYRKIVETNFTSSTGNQIIKTLSSLGLNNIDTVIKMKTISQGNPIEEDYFVSSEDTLRSFIDISNQFIVKIGNDFPTKPVKVYTIVEYTKTTD